jgi:hypothetical protein
VPTLCSAPVSVVDELEFEERLKALKQEAELKKQVSQGAALLGLGRRGLLGAEGKVYCVNAFTAAAVFLPTQYQYAALLMFVHLPGCVVSCQQHTTHCTSIVGSERAPGSRPLPPCRSAESAAAAVLPFCRSSRPASRALPRAF